MAKYSCGFSVTALVGVKKSKKVYADERIKAEMKSLSIPCLGGRGQSMVAGRRGDMEPKSRQIKKGGPLAIYCIPSTIYLN